MRICPGDTARLDAGLGDAFFSAAEYTWSNGESSAVIAVTETGEYIVQADFKGVKQGDTTIVIVLPNDIDLGVDTTFCEGSSFYLDAGTNFDRYLWQDGTTSQTFATVLAGYYEVTAENNCGVAMDAINLETENCTCAVYVPNAFSPNGDSINDLFFPNFSCGLVDPEGYHFQIFDRWGSAMYQSDDLSPGAGWDGSRRGEPAPPGTYGWRLTYFYFHPERGKVHEELTGEINLLR